MAIRQVKVVGSCEVAGIQPGRTGSIDDEQVNLAALVDAEHVELLPEPAKKPAKSKGDA